MDLILNALIYYQFIAIFVENTKLC